MNINIFFQVFFILGIKLFVISKDALSSAQKTHPISPKIQQKSCIFDKKIQDSRRIFLQKQLKKCQNFLMLLKNKKSEKSSDPLLEKSLSYVSRRIESISVALNSTTPEMICKMLSPPADCVHAQKNFMNIEKNPSKN
jgi:hypothetical protein